ncbi:MAG: radical SAM family heme chaperone HemW [Terriglobales bacterium]
MPLGIYISVPFCRSKCSYCNFASGVFPRAVYEQYVERVCADIRRAQQTAERMGGQFERAVDSIYVGGGTPTMLDAAQLERLFETVRQEFRVAPESEITVECAPGSLTPEMLEMLIRCGVNRVSLGVQSWMDEEARAVGRLHTRAATLDDIARLRGAGIVNLSVDLIAGLPHQTRESWHYSLEETIATGAGHVSVYMLEVDEDSRLGREVIAGGTRYHAHFVPDDELTADLYLEAIEALGAAGISQYEISNFARPGCQSRHNLKYWTRQPYLGFGVDAHSFLHAAGDGDGVRFATADSLDAYLAEAPLTATPVGLNAAREECFFLGLRLNRGVELKEVATRYSLSPQVQRAISELYDVGLLDYDREREIVRLTRDGRLLSNEVFERFIG